MRYLDLLPNNEDLTKIAGWRPGRGPGARPLVNFSCPQCLTVQTIPFDNPILNLAGGAGITTGCVKCQSSQCTFSDILIINSWWRCDYTSD